MFLKSLVIKGFKSFAERSVLDLEPGITVVVGPNGSGKSNIVDAIAWVLGAQAPSAVRSQKMDDVIFAGTSRRQALGRAEVSLTIDNSSGYLAVEFSEVTISRTLFRSGESEYAINGVSCRLLDIQELLSDAGVGRNQHVIASQGQLDAILNARPEERRAIIEEAAGVLKHRRRRERSERRLAATEANLSRVNDLLREVRRQLRPLERQAEAARRHAEIADELRQLRVHLAGREITALDQRVEAGRAREGALVARRAEIDGVLVGLDADVRAAEGRLAAVGAREVAELVSRTETLRERARGTAAVLAERRRATERELAALDDRSALVVLDRELEAAHSEVAEAEANVARLVGVGAELAESEAALADERSAADLGDDGEASAAAEAATSALAEARRELTGLAARLEQRRAELARADERRSRLAQRLARLEAEAPQPEADDAAEAAADGLARAVDAAERTRAEADAARAEAEQRHRELEAEARAWAARAEALAQALESVRAEAGASELAGRPGVLGTVADVLAIEPGSEAAVEAALGDARAAVVVAGAASARDALEALIAVGKPASVLALPAVAGGARVASPAGAPSGAPSALGGPTPTPTSVTARPLRERVRARSGLPSGDTAAIEQLLDGLCAATFVVEGDWRAGVDLALAHPALTLVTTEGDRFAARGWRLQAAGAGATAALVEEATERATAAKRDGARAADEHRAAREAAEAARRAHTQAVRAFDDHEARRHQAVQAAERVQRELTESRAEAESLDAQRAQLDGDVRADAARHGELDAELGGLRQAAELAAVTMQQRRTVLVEFERRAIELGRSRAQLDTRQTLASEQLAAAQARRAKLRASLDEAVAQTRQLEGRRDGLVARARATDQLGEVVARCVTRLDEQLRALQAERDRRAEQGRSLGRELDRLRGERGRAERELAELAERARRAELEITEASVRLEAAVEALRRDLEVEPETACQTDAPPLAPGIDAPVRLRDLERELRLLGPVNPLAIEEFAALTERHEFLETQLEDVRSSRRELAKVIRAIDDEISSTFAAAFADVGAHFTDLFATLFPGGKGELRLTDPDNLLDTGVEVEARPSGKNVRKLSLLSGGERSLTALGLLFAIFRSRPSPFYVLDEVEAPLDDVNLRRFLDLIEEFRGEAQLLIVSHQKRTMEIADCLYGVTMKPGESSKVVSERLRQGA